MEEKQIVYGDENRGYVTPAGSISPEVAADYLKRSRDNGAIATMHEHRRGALEKRAEEIIL